MLRQASTVILLLAAVGCAEPNAESTEPQDWSALVEEANEVLLNQGQLDRVGEFFTESYGGGQGPDMIREFVSDLRTAFPDLRVEVEVLLSGEDRVAWIRRHRGTHQGDFMGVPATGRELTWQSMTVSRMEDGLIAEEWGASELLGALRTPE